MNPDSSCKTSERPKFLADEMLGRLAKWLRFLGYDTRYVRDIPDSELLKIAESEGRIILTRDTLLIQQRRCRSFFFIRSDHWREQLRQIYSEAKLDCNSLFARCAVCNRPLHRVDKPSVRLQVPSYVYETQEEFSRCESCSRVFWSGTHVKKIRSELENIRRDP